MFCNCMLVMWLLQQITPEHICVAMGRVFSPVGGVESTALMIFPRCTGHLNGTECLPQYCSDALWVKM